jgi:hypothetical protein
VTDSGMRVWLEGGNPLDFDPDELTELSSELTSAVPGVDIILVVRQETGYGVTLNEVLVIWEEISRAAPNVAQGVGSVAKVATIVAGAVAWLRRRWKSDHERRLGRARPRTLVVCDRSGRIVRSVRIDMPEGQPLDEDNQIGRQYPRPSPGDVNERRPT